MDLLNLLFPKYCVGCKKVGSYVCDTCFSYITFADIEKCLGCGRPAIDGITHLSCRKKYTIDGTFSVLTYKGIVKKLMYVFKYKPYVTDIQHLLGTFFYEGLIQKEHMARLLQSDCLFVPIPLFKGRERTRGYNQASILAKELAKRFAKPSASLLERVKDTHTQVGRSREERKENMKGAFAYKGERITARIVFLVDDVLTTGATLSEAAAVLKKQGIQKVYGLTLAIGG